MYLDRNSMSLSSITLDFRYIANILFLILIAIVFSVLGEWLNFPLPWLLVPIFISIIWTLKQKSTFCLPNSFNVLGQAIIAVVTASRFSIDVFKDIQSFFIPLVICIVVTGIFSLLNGYLIYKWTKIDLITSLLANIPGGSAGLVAMSEEMGGDAIIVAMLQCLRIILVSLFVPIVASFYSAQSQLSSAIDNMMGVGMNDTLPNSLPIPINFLLLLLISIVSIQIGKKLKLPSNNFLAPFFGVLIFLIFFPYKIVIPHPIFCLGLFMFGISLGVKFEKSAIKKLTKALLIEMFLMLILIAICFVAAYEFHLFTHIDTMTSILGSSPGALNAMTATAIELGGNSSLVVTMQMIRMLLILVLTPLLLNFFFKDRFSEQ